MRWHRDLIAPKFAAVDRILTEQLGGTALATWTRPAGGYFLSLSVSRGCAKEGVRLAEDMGTALTSAGATHPYGRDPEDTTIRIAPTYPELAEIEAAITGLAVCVRLAAANRA